MDVNGTRFHLLQDKTEDWGECFQENGHEPLNWFWKSDPDNPVVNVIHEDGALQLSSLTRMFRRFGRRPIQNVDLFARRGASRDQYGNTYWIDETNTGINFLGAASDQWRKFWTSLAATPKPANSGEFHPVTVDPPTPLHLRGLTVTTNHYLIVGYIEMSTFTGRSLATTTALESGILIFDLHQNNVPERRVWPQTDTLREFLPWDMTAAPDGGVFILDRNDGDPSQSFVWVLDRHFRLRAEILSGPHSVFYPEGENQSSNQRINEVTVFANINLDDEAHNPFSIDIGPEGRILILDRGNLTARYIGDDILNQPNYHPSSILVYREGEDPGSFEFERRLILRIRVSDQENEDGRIENVLGHDFVYANEDTPKVYVADMDGNQVILFQPDLDKLADSDDKTILQEGKSDYIPLRRWGGKSLIFHRGQVYYDVNQHWARLTRLESNEFVRRAVVVTPTEIDPGHTFDSTISGCVWHRLLIDASIPVGTGVTFRAKAADDKHLLPFVSWEEQPLPYLRRTGSELPYYTHPKILEVVEPYPQPLISETQGSVTDRTGTWEVLFQHVHGRYLQLEITLEGTGRSTPQIYALRAWFPRFSYLENYLPAIYSEDEFHSSFLDRWLANFEGVFTNLEDKIENLPRLVDARSTPREALDWLSSWMGLVLDPLWKEEQKRFFVRNAQEFYKRRGTKDGLEMMLRLYLDQAVSETTFWSNFSRNSFVRIEEAIIRRAPDGQDDPRNAHLFTVLVPPGLSHAQLEMVERIVSLEKPAHTDFTIRTYRDSFAIGTAVLGVDTQLRTQLRREGSMRLGTTRLNRGQLAASYPLDVSNRLILGRDRLDDMPEL